jgi:hypothetical protein
MRGDSGERPRAAHWEHERVDDGVAARMAGARDLKKSILMCMVVDEIYCSGKRCVDGDDDEVEKIDDWAARSLQAKRTLAPFPGKAV